MDLITLFRKFGVYSYTNFLYLFQEYGAHHIRIPLEIETLLTFM